METFNDFLATIDHLDQRNRVGEVLTWITNEFPQLEQKIAWNEPMFTDHGTFIIGFSVAKHHMAVSPEVAGVAKFEEGIKKAGYTYTKGIFRIKWTDEVDYDLLRDMIAFNIMDKTDATSFWR